MLSLLSAQVKAFFLIPGLTWDYTVKHTMASDCIAGEAVDGAYLDGRVARRRVVGMVLLLPMAQPTGCDSRPRPGLQAHLWKRRQTGRGGPGRRFPSTGRG
jgi:hypothetical protein